MSEDFLYMCRERDRITVFVRHRKDLCVRFERLRALYERLRGRKLKNVELLEEILDAAEKSVREELRMRTVFTY